MQQVPAVKHIVGGADVLSLFQGRPQLRNLRQQSTVCNVRHRSLQSHLQALRAQRLRPRLAAPRSTRQHRLLRPTKAPRLLVCPALGSLVPCSSQPSNLQNCSNRLSNLQKQLRVALAAVCDLPKRALLMVQARPRLQALQQSHLRLLLGHPRSRLVLPHTPRQVLPHKRHPLLAQLRQQWLLLRQLS